MLSVSVALVFVCMFCPGVAGISCPAEEVKAVATIGGNSEPGGRSVSNQQTMTCYGFSYEKCLRQTNNGHVNEKPCHHILSRQIRIIHAAVQEWLPRVKDPSNLELFSSSIMKMVLVFSSHKYVPFDQGLFFLPLPRLVRAPIHWRNLWSS